MTLDTYGHLFENRLDEVADARDAARDAERERGLRATDIVAAALPAVAPVLPEHHIGRNAKDPCPTFPQVRGSFCLVAPTGFEPALPP